MPEVAGRRRSVRALGHDDQPVGQLGMAIRSSVRSWFTRCLVIAVLGVTIGVGPTSLASASVRHLTVVSTSSCGVLSSTGVSVTGGTPCVASTSVGTAFQLSLRKGLHWRGLRTSSSVVKISNVVSGSTGGLTATVVAAEPGATTLTASGAPICVPGEACPQFVLLWTLRVVVSSSSTPRAMVVTLGDSGRHDSAVVGQRVYVRLMGGTSARWSEPIARPTTSLHRITGTSGRPATATFIAERRGVTTVTSLDTIACSPTCSPSTVLFRITIRVG